MNAVDAGEHQPVIRCQVGECAVHRRPVGRLTNFDHRQSRADRAQLLQAQDDLWVARAGGKPDQAAKVAGDLTNAQKKRERLQKNHDALVHLMAQQAATQEVLTANDLELSNAQAEVARLTAVKQEFDRSVMLESDRAALGVQQLRDRVAALEEAPYIR